jgi:hypothetical protein
VNDNTLRSIVENSLDLFRISRAKKLVDLSPNTIRKLHRECGLRIYFSGGASWVSRSELEAVIRAYAKAEPKPRRRKLDAQEQKCPVVIRGENLDSDRDIDRGSGR